MKALRLDGKKALVFGKGRFTETILTALAEAGARPALVTWDSDTAKEMAGRFQIPSLPINPLSEEEVEGAIRKVMGELGELDILVNETMFELYRPFTQISLKDWEKGLYLNLSPPFLSIRALGKHFCQKKSGRIINLVSALGARGVAGGAAFSAYMGALTQLTKSLAIEWAREGVRVNGIGTGWFEGNVEDESLKRMIPLGRLGKSWEVGPLVIYLASGASEFVTGQIYYIDGGILVRP